MDISPKNLRRYMFKLYPNKEQKAALDYQCKRHAKLWNILLEQREKHWSDQKKLPEGDRRGLTFFDQSKEITNLRKSPEWSVLNFSSLERTAKNLDLAFKAFFSRLKKSRNGLSDAECGYPRYKDTLKASSIPFRDHNGWKMTLDSEIKAKALKGKCIPRQTDQKISVQNGKITHSNRDIQPTGGIEPVNVGDVPQKDRNDRWRIYVYGVAGLIKARGEFPIPPDDFRDMTILFRDNSYWMSVAVRMQSRRNKGESNINIDLNLVDRFADISLDNNITSMPDDPTISLNKSVEIDKINSKADTKFKKFSWRWRNEKKRMARRSAKLAKLRKDKLHNWTNNIISVSNSIIVTRPLIKDNTTTGKGDEKNHGAAVKTVALMNRNVLNQAPSMAIEMLTYKANEAGVELQFIDDTNPFIGIAQDISATVKIIRKTQCALKG